MDVWEFLILCPSSQMTRSGPGSTRDISISEQSKIHVYIMYIKRRGEITEIIMLNPNLLKKRNQSNRTVRRVCTSQVKFCRLFLLVQPPIFFCNFVCFKSIREKIWKRFTEWGKNMYFPPLFRPLLIIFFPQHDTHIFASPPPPTGSNRIIYTPGKRLYIL